MNRLRIKNLQDLCLSVEVNFENTVHRIFLFSKSSKFKKFNENPGSTLHFFCKQGIFFYTYTLSISLFSFSYFNLRFSFSLCANISFSLSQSFSIYTFFFYICLRSPSSLRQSRSHSFFHFLRLWLFTSFS